MKTINETADESTGLKEYIKIIEDCEIISFDIFDTLLVRPYKKPVDLFLHLEKLYSAKNYAQKRIKAEKKARKINKEQEDITFDSIYENLEPQYQFLKEKELELEFEILKPNPSILEFYNLAISLNKNIIITSDMYLPKDFLIKVLHKNGFCNFSKIYLSSELMKTKQTSTLYKYIIDDLKTEPDKICHIGDNCSSDIINAQKLGLKTIYIEKKVNKLLKENERINLLNKKFPNNIGCSILTGLLSNFSQKKGYWYNFGFVYAGPVILSFVDWLIENFKRDNIQTALFVARDGYILKKVFEILYGENNIRSVYIYAQRKLKSKYLYDKNENNEYRKYINSLNINNEILIKEDGDFKPDKEKNTNIALIDTVSLSFSAITLIQNFLQGNFYEYYWSSNKKLKPKNKIKNYKTDNKSFHFDWNVMEFFMSSPEPPIEDIRDLKPVYKEMSEEEAKRIEIYKELSSGIIGFTELVKNIFNDKKIYFDYNFINCLLEILNKISTQDDKSMFKDIMHASNENHTNQIKIFPRWYRDDENLKFYEYIFSIKHEYKRRIIRILGFKIKL